MMKQTVVKTVTTKSFKYDTLGQLTEEKVEQTITEVTDVDREDKDKRKEKPQE
jgi:hypothetical protein